MDLDLDISQIKTWLLEEQAYAEAMALGLRILSDPRIFFSCHLVCDVEGMTPFIDRVISRAFGKLNLVGSLNLLYLPQFGMFHALLSMPKGNRGCFLYFEDIQTGLLSYQPSTMRPGNVYRLMEGTKALEQNLERFHNRYQGYFRRQADQPLLAAGLFHREPKIISKTAA